MKEIKFYAEWTDDCQGKKDYDGQILSISTRYWPRGGSALIFDGSTGTMTDRTDQKRQSEIKPSAKSSLMLMFSDEDGYEAYNRLVEKEFEAETEEEVKNLVEIWAQEQMNTVVSILRNHFKNF